MDLMLVLHSVLMAGNKGVSEVKIFDSFSKDKEQNTFFS